MNKITPYIEIARPSHWVKNVFIIPGVLLVIFFLPEHSINYLNVFLGIISTCLIASGYYVLNEILDARSDSHHPDKCKRPIPSGKVDLKIAYLLWATATILGLGISVYIGYLFTMVSVGLFVMSLIYNVSPVRMKDLPYLDVIVESTNNPLRLMIGWYATGITSHPTLSLIVAYWMFGAFLMGVKRFAELKHINNKEVAGLYRKSFSSYTSESLLVSVLIYAILFSFALGIFIARYRIELIIATPLIGLSMGMYLLEALRSGVLAQNPEKIFKFHKIFWLLILTFFVSVFSLFFDIPYLDQFFKEWYINSLMH